MATDFTKVDTDEVRRAARQIAKIAGEVEGLSTRNVRSIQSNIDENFKGEAADALTEVLADLSSDIRRISGGLDTIQKKLRKYTDSVEEAAREAADAIKG